MTLKDISQGPAEAILLIIFSLLNVISIIFLSGHGFLLLKKKKKE